MKVFHGTVVHSTKDTPMQVLEDSVVGVQNNKIVFVDKSSKLDDIRQDYDYSKEDIITFGPHEFLMPGFVDAHVHASQYGNSGTGLDLPLLDWLEKYTFPLEATFKDIKFAENAYGKAVRRLLKNGTTTACYFATIHLESTLKLCDIVDEAGQRALVGKVCMDRNSPTYYVETTDQSLQDTETFVKSVLERKNPLLTPVFTPRFAVTSTPQFLYQLGQMIKNYDLPLQSHLSENVSECQLIQELYPESKHYCDVYDKYGLFTNKTIMAHGVYLSDEEIGLIQERGVGIVHCPNSNFSLTSGMCNVRKLLNNGIKLGLGTDMSGGYSPSLLDAIRHSTHASNMIKLKNAATYQQLNYKDAFRLATLGGAEVLGLQDKIGNFEVGKEFDALRVNLMTPDSPLDIFERDTLQDRIQKLFYLGDDRNITQVFVAGSKVLDKTGTNTYTNCPC